MSWGLSRNQNGLTLVEVMIALAIFSVGILAVAAMQNVGMTALARARSGSDHSRQAAGQIEAILSMDYDDPTLVDGDNGYHPETPDHGPQPLPGGQASIEWEVDDDFPFPGTKRISVTVHAPANGRGGGPVVYDYVKARNFR
ncbi:MAG: prepilin-type N-terminal cleavage/methylation domain-containing protein [Desulfatitalea sp.]|nr:prepilin-type N-terminal cleavage/methylation domain-containing protein [Desulfatitalea sp.]MBI5894996.1 prepilin-type N-terminal cleavage/methylation domain-containing protein [Desulfobacterales bacterium]